MQGTKKVGTHTGDGADTALIGAERAQPPPPDKQNFCSRRVSTFELVVLNTDLPP